MTKLYIDLNVQAMYIKTDGSDILVDIRKDGYVTKDLSNVMNADYLAGIEALHFDSIQVVDKNGNTKTFDYTE